MILLLLWLMLHDVAVPLKFPHVLFPMDNATMGAVPEKFDLVQASQRENRGACACDIVANVIRLQS